MEQVQRARTILAGAARHGGSLPGSARPRAPGLCYDARRVPSKPETLWSSDEAELTHDRRDGLVRFVRLSPSLPSLPVLRARMIEMLDIMDTLPRGELGLIVDTRLAIGRSDDEFEGLMNELRPRMVGGFRRVAVLVRSAVGRLQVQRLGRADGISDRLLVTSDEAEALTFARRP